MRCPQTPRPRGASGRPEREAARNGPTRVVRWGADVATTSGRPSAVSAGVPPAAAPAGAPRRAEATRRTPRVEICAHTGVTPSRRSPDWTSSTSPTQTTRVRRNRQAARRPRHRDDGPRRHRNAPVSRANRSRLSPERTASVPTEAATHEAATWSSFTARHRRRDRRTASGVAVPPRDEVVRNCTQLTARLPPGRPERPPTPGSGCARRRRRSLRHGGPPTRTGRPTRSRRPARPPMSRLERPCGLLEVLGPEHARGSALEEDRFQDLHPLEVDLAENGHAAVVLLADEGEVEDADDAAVDEVEQQREGFPAHPLVLEADDEVVDRPHLVEGGLSSSSVVICSPGGIVGCAGTGLSSAPTVGQRPGAGVIRGGRSTSRAVDTVLSRRAAGPEGGADVSPGPDDGLRSVSVDPGLRAQEGR